MAEKPILVSFEARRQKYQVKGADNHIYYLSFLVEW